MKTLTSAIYLASWSLVLAIVLLVQSARAQTSGQYSFQQKNAGPGFTPRNVTPIAGRAFGLDGSGNPAMLSVSGGSGLENILSSITGDTLTFTGTLTAPRAIAWRDLAGTVAFTSDLSAYLTTATAASTYQPLDSELTALAGLTSAADRLPYYTGSGTASLATFTSTARSLLDDASTSAMRITLGLGDYGTSGINYGAQFILDAASGSIASQGDIEANLFSGSGANLTALNGTQITSGTVADARLSANVSLLGQTISLTSEVTGTLPIANGGTGATTAADARIALLPSMVGNGGKFLRVNAGATDYEVATISGGGDALTSGTLAQFAATTSAQLRGVLSDESGTGVFLTANGSAADLTSFPTLNQSTTGNAATATALQTGRTINGTTFDGTANITVTAAADTLTGTTLASGVTASSLTSAAGGSFGTAAYTAATAYEVPLTFSTGLTRTTNTVTVNTSQSLSVLSNLTTNGFIKTTGGTGTLSIDTATYQVSDADLDDLADGSLTGTLVAAASTTARGSVELAADGETSASLAIQGNDNRLADAEKIEIGVAISDETTALTTGTAKVTFRMPCAMTVTAVRLSLTTVSSSGTPTVDINEAGTTILSTKLTCDASEKTSTTAATAAVISDSALADDAEITLDIDTAGTGATGAKVWIIGTR